MGDNPNKKILDYIKLETSPYYPYQDLDEIITLFLDVLDYEVDEDELSGVGRRISAALSSLVESQDVNSLSLILPTICKVEQYARKLLYLENYSSYNEIVAEKKGFSYVLKALGVRLTLQKSNPTEEEKIINSVYNLRNIEAHGCKGWTIRQCYEKITDALTVYLILTHFHKNSLKGLIYCVVESDTVDFGCYAQKIVDEFKASASKFVPLDSSENASVSALYAVESADDIEKKVRKGTVQALINSIPEKRMILRGEAGAGKTTTLEYLAYVDAQDYLRNHKNVIPVLVYLGSAVNEHWTLEQYIQNKLGIDETTCEELLRSGKLRLYLDGYNEIPLTEMNRLKSKRRREISIMLKEYQKSFILLTNRPQEGKEFYDVPVFNLLEMNDQQIENFLKRNTTNVNCRKIINNEIKKDLNLKKMVQRPLILQSLLLIVQTFGQVPKREGQIIGMFLKALFERERQEKFDEYLDEDKINLMLRKLGYESFDRYKTNAAISEEEIIDIFGRCQREYHFSYDNLYVLRTLTALGILNKRDGRYVFAHQAYQDYYCAQETKAILNL